MITTVTVASGFAVSSPVTLEPSATAFAVLVASHTPVQVAVDFAITSGGGSELVWHRYTSPEGNAFVVSSGTPLPACSVVVQAPSPWFRLHWGSTALAATSATIFPAR